MTELPQKLKQQNSSAYPKMFVRLFFDTWSDADGASTWARTLLRALKHQARITLEIICGENPSQFCCVTSEPYLNVYKGHIGAKHGDKGIVVFHGAYLAYDGSLDGLLSLAQRNKIAEMQELEFEAAQRHVVVAVSHDVAQRLRHAGVKTKHVISLPVDLSLFRPLHRFKDIEFLSVMRCDSLVKDYPTVYRMVEIGANVATLPGVCHGMMSMIETSGKSAAWSNMPSIYNRSRVVIHPSVYEGGPYAVLEALACGIPAVMREVGIGVELKKEFPRLVACRGASAEDFYWMASEQLSFPECSKKLRSYVRRHHCHQKVSKDWFNLFAQYVNIN